MSGFKNEYKSRRLPAQKSEAIQKSKLHGVNLGGWLLVEKWMTPSLFDGTDAVDEFTFMHTSGAAAKLERHRKTFITENDFEWLATHGINALRLPLGYWALGGSTPYLSALPYVDWAMKTAQKYKLAVILDLHGLEGSQNGRDHSGRIGRSEWFTNRGYRSDSITALKQLALRYKDYENLWGIQIINEPKFGFFHFKLRRFYKQAYSALELVLHERTKIIFSDAMTPRLLSGALGRSNRVVMDVHFYHMTTLLSNYYPLWWYYRVLRSYRRLIKRLSKVQPVIIGEWSGTLRGEFLSGLTKTQAEELTKRHIELQLAVYKTARGWFYWNYKTEHRGTWNYRSLVEDGILKTHPHRHVSGVHEHR